MKRLMTWVCLLGFLTCLVGQAAAEDKKPEKKKPDVEAQFKKLDTSGDGKLSEDEFCGKKEGEAKDKAKKAFARKDKNKDGSVDLEEFKAVPKKKKDA